MSKTRLIVAVGLGLISTAAQASDLLMRSADGSVTFRGSYGITAIEANELVYQGKSKVSQLIWKSEGVSTLTGEVQIDLDRHFYLKASGAIGIGGNGHMVDYDWFNPGGAWTHRSIHPDTRLEHYFALGLEAGRDVFEHDATTMSLGGGFKYTDVKWTAFGGSYVYSSSGFRDDRGNFPDAEKGISYRQQWPVPYVGLNASHSEGQWTFAGSVRGGVAFDGKGTDDHWMRDLRFIDSLNPAPALLLSASADYAVRPNAALYVAGSFDRIFRTDADTVMIDKLSGSKASFKDGAGGDYRSVTVSFGLKGQF